MDMAERTSDSVTRSLIGLVGLTLALSIAPAIAYLCGRTPEGWQWLPAWSLVAIPQLIWCGLESRCHGEPGIRPCGLSLAQGMAALVVILAAAWTASTSVDLPTVWIFLAASAIIAAGIVLRQRAICDLGDGFRSDIELNPGHQLHVTGIYQKMRHPSELGLLLILGGSTIVAGSLLAAGVFVFISLPLSVWRSRLEDRLLINEFGEPATAYREATPAWSLVTPIMTWIDAVRDYLKNLHLNIRRPPDLLITISLLSAAIWYAEVWLRGWNGLHWISYFHLAVPLGLAMFLFWVSHQTKFQNSVRNYLFVASLAGFSGFSYLIIRWGIYSHYGYAWAGLMLPESLSPSLRWLLMHSVYFTAPSVPPVFWLISRMFGIRFRRRDIMIGWILYLAAIPVAIFFLHLIPHPGRADALHAVKTGFCIPTMMIGLGLPFCFPFKRQGFITPA